MSAPTTATVKKLFAVSGNRCAFNGCTEKLVDETGTLLGEICHICGDKPGSKRYDPKQPDAERQDFSNLIVLCPNHHTVIDSDEIRYSAPIIRHMKRRHEVRASEPYFISDETADRIVLLMGGAVAGVGLTEIAKGLGHVLGTLSGVLGTPEIPKKTEQKKNKEEPHETIKREAGEILRYAPKGAFTYFAKEQITLAVCGYFADLFATNGWRQVDQGKWDVGAERPGSTSFCMAFFLNDPHQVSTAKQAIDEVFGKHGFERIGKPTDGEWFGPEHGFKAFIFVGPTK